MASKFSLGSAQFGLDYGTVVKTDKVSEQSAHELLDLALNSGIDTIDTATAYGDSESVIGRFARRNEFSIVTKVFASSKQELVSAVKQSLNNLKTEHVYAVLFHSFKQYEENPLLWDALLELREKKLIQKAGFSVYSPNELRKALDAGHVPDLVQVPYNILDRRFESLFGELSAAGTEIYARSAYLQGVLLTDPKELPLYLQKLAPKIKRIRETAEQQGMALAEFLLQFAANNQHIAKVVVGICDKTQYEPLLKHREYKQPSSKIMHELKEEDENLILPTNWNKPLQYLAIIQARTGSTRLPGKVLLGLNGKPVLERVINRVRAAKKVSAVLVATTTEESDNAVEKLCRELGCACVRGSASDVLDRFYKAAAPLKPVNIVRISADCPLMDPLMIDAVLELKDESGADYASNVFKETYPDGECVEVFSFAALEEAWKEAVLSSEREHVTPYIRKHPELFKHASKESGVYLGDKRWTLDEPNDYEFIKAIYKQFPAENELFGIQEILEVLKRNPELEAINSGIIRNEGYLKSLREDNAIENEC